MAGPASPPTREHKRSPKQNTSNSRRALTADCATAQDQCHPRKLFIGGLAHKTTTQQLRDYFQRYGSIVDAVVLRWPDGRSRGFGYVTFQDAAAVSAAVEAQAVHQVDGRQVDVKRAVPGTNKLFVGGLPQNTAATEMREHFETFGVVSDAVVMIDPATGRSRGFGFVCFLPGQEGAAAVQAALNQYQAHKIRGKWIEVKSAAPPHKLTGKESEAGTPPGLCSTPSSQSAELPAHTMPDFQLPPAMPQQACPPKHKQQPKVAYEPQRITTTATMQAPFAGMPPPPGLLDSAKSKGVAAAGFVGVGTVASQAPYPNLMTGNSLFSSHAPWRRPDCGLQSDPKMPGLVSSRPAYIDDQELSGASSLSSSLQSSLELLLRQQAAARLEVGKGDTHTSLTKGPHAECGSPAKVFCHGG